MNSVSRTKWRSEIKKKKKVLILVSYEPVMWFVQSLVGLDVTR